MKFYPSILALPLTISAIAVSGEELEFDFKAETKLNFRHSENVSFATNFPPGSALETVDEGSHLEISNIALIFNVGLTENITIRTKFDIFDLYEKNPTSSDLDVSMDRFIVRYGKKSLFTPLEQGINWYAQIGKFGKFERQEDRHLESYGLSSTAFNRVEDSGLEFGLDLANGLYGIFSYTSGNPVFFRDPNALAGDNGVFNNAEYKSGIVMLYDAEVEEFNLSDTPETGLAAGYRWISPSRDTRFNLMLFGYQRDLAETKELHGTSYGGDLDLFEFSELYTLGLIDPNNDDASLLLSDKEKTETGINLWWYKSNLSIFAQYVDQSIGGLDRDGGELELSYRFDTLRLPWLRDIEPVVRYSVLNNNFKTPPNNPSPSISWDWTKLDLGVNLHFTRQIFLSLEYAINSFEVKGNDEESSEALLTFTWRYD